MKEKIFQNIFSLSGSAIAIGVVGGMSGFVTLFVDVNTQLSIKWLLLTMLISISLTIILLKMIYDLSTETKPPAPFENPIRYVKEEEVFVIRRNENFLNNIIVGCYAQINEIDRLAYIGVVHLVQDKVIQIKIKADMGALNKIPMLTEELNNITIRPVVPITAIEQFRNLERENG
ncbi:MAG: hypothetical protein PHI97_28420 [Desulfobulbus sp.]|nr:hypothetical protein [Desulfobulbus sp.]